MKKPESICVFGDSTAWGGWDLEKGGWVTRLWLHIGNRDENYVELYNQSISGGTSKTILDRFEAEARARNANALIFQTGGNDASYEEGKDATSIPLEVFEKNIEEIISRAKKITDRIIFMDLKNCDESKTMPVSWIPIYYSNENIRKYSEAMEAICKKEGVLFLDISKLENDEFEDGLHPNAKGHEKIFQEVKAFLINNSWI